MPSTTTYKRGQVVVVRVPLSDQTGFKPRPALVASAEGFHRRLSDVIVCPISSRPRYYEAPPAGDHPLVDWKVSGLRHPSTARVSKLLAVDKRIIGRAIGKLSAGDMARVDTGLRKALGRGK
jgi:mRNA-degrading endonuclease toxin of MazEF toxin-antitoxin module